MVLFDHLWWKRLNFDSTSSRVAYNQSKVTLAIIKYFDLDERNTNIARELKAGILHFISVSFILSINPKLLAENSSYNALDVAAFTAISIGLSCIICGLVSNLPFVLAPTTSTSLYFALYLQTHNLSMAQGNLVIFLLGILISLCSIRSISLFLSELIPFALKVGACLGISLLIGLEALVEIGLVKTGEKTVLVVGNIYTPEIYIAIASFLIIGISLHHRIRGAFLIGLFFGTMMFWIQNSNSNNSWPPKNIFINGGSLTVSLDNIQWTNPKESYYDLFKLVFDLCIICIILLNGLADGLADTAKLKRDDNTLIYLSCGIGTIISAFLGVGPVLISPESAAAIRSGGAKTGLSVVVCGLLFLISTVFSPIFANVPVCSTSPILLIIGMMLFENAEKVSWSSVKEALPVFIIMIFVPFTYSLFNGISFGLAVYIVLLIFTDKGFSLQKLIQIIPESLRNRIGRGSDSSVSFEPDMSEDGYVHLSGSEPMLHETSYPPWESNDSNLLVALRNRLTEQNGEGDDSDDESDDPYQAEVDKSKSLSFTMCEIRNDKDTRRDKHKVGFQHPLMTPNATPGITNDEHEQYMRRKTNDDDEVTL